MRELATGKGLLDHCLMTTKRDDKTLGCLVGGGGVNMKSPTEEEGGCCFCEDDEKIEILISEIKRNTVLGVHFGFETMLRLLRGR